MYFIQFVIYFFKLIISSTMELIYNFEDPDNTDIKILTKVVNDMYNPSNP